MDLCSCWVFPHLLVVCLALCHGKQIMLPLDPLFVGVFFQCRGIHSYTKGFVWPDMFQIYIGASYTKRCVPSPAGCGKLKAMPLLGVLVVMAFLPGLWLTAKWQTLKKHQLRICQALYTQCVLVQASLICRFKSPFIVGQFPRPKLYPIKSPIFAVWLQVSIVFSYYCTSKWSFSIYSQANQGVPFFPFLANAPCDRCGNGNFALSCSSRSRTLLGRHTIWGHTYEIAQFGALKTIGFMPYVCINKYVYTYTCICSWEL